MLSNQEYKLRVKIVSEAIFSSGEKESNLVQTKVLADQYGFVYFHAKSLKGQLKRQGLWLLKQYHAIDAEKAASFFKAMVTLFGINAEELRFYCQALTNCNPTQSCSRRDCPEYIKFCTPQEGMMNIGHLELDEQIKDFFILLQNQNEDEAYYRLSAHDLIEAQTHIRTGIQVEDGIVVNNMMTTYHTVKEGLYFYSTLSFNTEPTDALIEDLGHIIYSFRRIGAGIHRGRGEIEAHLLQNGKEWPPKASEKEGE